MVDPQEHLHQINVYSSFLINIPIIVDHLQYDVVGTSVFFKSFSVWLYW